MTKETLFERPILFYSDYCVFSSQFVKTLMQDENIFQAFIRVNIDVNHSTKRRPDIFYKVQNALEYKIVEVPTIITNNGEYVLAGEEAFKWLEFQLQRTQTENHVAHTQHAQNNELNPFNPNEMGGFSDMYSQFGNNDLCNASQQSFKFLGAPDENIQTPEESTSVSADQYKEYKIQMTSNTYSNRNINGNDNGNMGRGVEHFSQEKPERTGKKNDMDKQLEKLLADRETQLPPPIARVG